MMDITRPHIPPPRPPPPFKGRQTIFSSWDPDPLTLHREIVNTKIFRNTVEIRYTQILACKEGRQLEPALPLPPPSQSEKQENRLIIRVLSLYIPSHRTQVLGCTSPS
ncbi:hypothetical protein CDAR_47971 [Caerostris darwini]|uniref:Uncharacterized protein n=1 Tax=Caerostris darwini TaxID=1538125 RepID=A0AAV4VP44_9ARAC|nr:hypothetical protein CDAR_47971 [Caerostris darwini]